MSFNLDSPVQTQMAVAVIKSPISSSEYHGSRQPSGIRRVFVQTETGFVLGMELDRRDNAHTVKRRLQIALNVPIEERSLTFGDTVLKNDLSFVRNDSALLLTRNLIHRSSSTPCLSPTGKEIQHRDCSGPIEVLGHSSFFDEVRELVKHVGEAMQKGVDPVPVHNGLGGAYYFKNTKGESVAIIKPTDEEPFAPNNPKGFVGKALGQPGLKRSVRVGETGFREVAAYLLDYDHFANVPATALVKVTHSIFKINDEGYGKSLKKKKQVSKIASFQKFMAHDFDASDHGTSSFPVSSVHRIGILDVRILNTDRHAGNLLVKKHGNDGAGGRMFGFAELIPIDHGLCLPENLEDPYFEWIHWPQSSIPFSEDELEYVRKLNPVKDCDMLRKELPMIREACLRVLVLCTVFLQEAAGSGLCLAEIGEMMSREYRAGAEEPSEFELVCIEARMLIDWNSSGGGGGGCEDGDDYFQFSIDCDDAAAAAVRSPDVLLDFGFGRNPFSRLQESIQEVEEEDEDACGGGGELSKSLSWSAEKKNYKVAMCSKDSFSSSSAHRSANEQLPGSSCFVRVGDMAEEEWGLFLDKFQELLRAALAKHGGATAGQRQRQRLGTSCQF